MATKQLGLVLRLAREQRDAAAARLAEAQQRLSGASEQLEQLINYQRQYAQQSDQTATRGVSVQALADARRFIAELDNVISAQRDRVASHEREVSGFADSWADATRYMQSIEQLIALRQAEEQQRQTKKEQQQADDLYAQQLFGR